MSNFTSVKPLDDRPRPVLTPISAGERGGGGDGGGGEPFTVEAAICVVGEATAGFADLRLDSPLVSRCHALIVNDRGETYVRDLASLNGVILNGAAVREARLERGDVLGIGPFGFSCTVAPAVRNFDPLDSDYEALSDTVADAADRSAAVRILSGAGADTAGRTFLLDARTFLIGSRQGCDLRLAGAAAVHAVILRRERRHFLLELCDEAAAAAVEGARGREARRLRHGDEIRIGAVRLRYELSRRARERQDAMSDEGSLSRLPRPPRPEEFTPPRDDLPLEEAEDLMAGDVPRSTGLSSRFALTEAQPGPLPPEVAKIPMATEAELLGRGFGTDDDDGDDDIDHVQGG